MGISFSILPFDELNGFSISLEDDELARDIHFRNDDESSSFSLAASMSDEVNALLKSVQEEGLNSARVEGATEELVKKIDEKVKRSTEIDVMLYDRIAFCFGVFNVALTPFVAGRFPQHAGLYFTLKFLALILFRYFDYRKKRWHFFLLDFCYVVNALLILQIWLFRSSLTFFNAIFLLAHSPVLWAVVTWRNSLVFHSVDKSTSVFIHLGPVLAQYTILWESSFCADVGGCSLRLNDYLAAFAIYLTWQLVYYLLVEVLWSKKVQEDDYLTSFRCMMASRHSLVAKICLSCGEKLALPLFMLVQFMYTVLTMLPVGLYYSSQLLHAFVYVMVFAVSVWNASGFYFKVFAKRYVAELEQRRKKKQ